MTTTAPQPVRVPDHRLAGELRAIRVVWERELVRFANDRLRLITSLVQPLLFLFVLGTGLSQFASGTTSGTSFRTFLYPGILAMAVLFTAMFSAASIVWDREFGFLREMLVAPIRRSSIVLGKCLGGATVATFQGLLVVLLAGLVDVPYSPTLIVEVFALQLLLAYTITAFGVMVAARISQIQSYMALTQMLVMPLFFLSGALFPVQNLPGWLAVLNRLDPLTYGVEPIRHVVFEHLDLSAATRARLDPGITWFGWPVPTLLCVAVVVVLGAVLTFVAILEFEKRD
ncbi:MAG: type transporter [Jatrophihabitans sp.]|jgi:ABC-2 type transport system permease protein|nr:type transporter [Jatrophihabitans sp.]MDT4904422.1 type transport system permease protein [Pseudonocardiales bacterium]